MFLLLTALAVILTWPAAAHLGSVVVNLGDPLLTVWILAWDVHALTTAPLRLLDANIFHPHRWTLVYTDHLLGLVPLVALPRLLGASVLLAHNLVWLATFPLTGLTMFWLVRHLTGHAGAAAVAAVLYAFSHFRFGQLDHVQVLSHQWLPLMLLGLHRAALSGGRWQDLGLAAGAFTLQALSSGYQAYLAAIAGAVFLAWVALPAGRPALGRLVARGAIVGGLTVLVLLPFFLPYRAIRGEVGLRRDHREIALYSAEPRSYLAVPAANRWLGTATTPFRTFEGALFPGLVALSLGLVGAILAWRRPETAAAPGTSDPRRWSGVVDLILAAVLLWTAANWLLVGGVFVRLGSFRLSQRQFGWPVLGLVIALALRRIADGGPRPIRGLGWLRRLGWPNAAGFYVGLTVVGVLASFGPRLALGPEWTSPAALRAAVPAGPRLRRAPGPGPLRRPRHHGPRGPGGARRRRHRAPASPARLAGRDAGDARRPRRARDLGRAVPLHERRAPAGARRPVAGRPAGPRRGGRPADVRAARDAPRESSPLRIDRALAPARQRLRRRLPARLCRRHRHAEHVPGSGRGRPAPDAPRPLRRGAPRPVPPGAPGAARGGARGPAPGRHTRHGVRARPDLRGRPGRAAGVRRAGWCGRRPGRARARRHPPGRPTRARRSRRRS